MKIIEIMGSLLLPITNEEHEVLEKITEQGIDKRGLNEREIYLANQLVNKNALYRLNQDGTIKYYKQTNSRAGG